MQSEGGVHFRVWATQPQHVEVVLEGGPGQTPGAAPMVVALEPEGHGYFSGLVAEAGAGQETSWNSGRAESTRIEAPADRASPSIGTTSEVDREGPVIRRPIQPSSIPTTLRCEAASPCRQRPSWKNPRSANAASLRFASAINSSSPRRRPTARSPRSDWSDASLPSSGWSRTKLAEAPGVEL